MLSLTRKINQTIKIGENIEIIISDIGTDKVKISIDAPKDIKILRGELVELQDINCESVSNRKKLDVNIGNIKKLLTKN